MSNHSLPVRGTDPPFSHKSVVSVTHEQNIICRKKLICRQLFAGHLVSSRPMKRKEKINICYSPAGRSVLGKTAAWGRTRDRDRLTFLVENKTHSPLCNKYVS